MTVFKQDADSQFSYGRLEIPQELNASFIGDRGTFTLYNVCSLHRGMFRFSTSGDIMMNVGGYHEYIEGYHEYIGGYHDACGGAT